MFGGGQATINVRLKLLAQILHRNLSAKRATVVVSRRDDKWWLSNRQDADVDHVKLEVALRVMYGATHLCCNTDLSKGTHDVRFRLM